jgi:tRNA A-37 threonylcarbamoyl transferase component Bud32
MDESILNQRLDRFIIVERLKAGGVAIVYKAFDPQINREVALKLLQENWAQHEEVVKRFERETQIMMQISHPHIIRYVDQGKRKNQPYIVMDFIEGGSLSDKIKRIAEISLGGTSRLLLQISSALDYAHKKGIVHRDLKPGNILLSDANHAYLTDFGIARVIDMKHTMLTTDGYMPGTPHYMSPEQARGADEIDHRSDIYSLGIIAFLLVAGKLPFTGEDPFVIINKHLTEPPPKPGSLNRDLPEALDNVILKALEKKPDKRYQTATAFASEFERAIQEHRKVIVRINTGTARGTDVDGNEIVFSSEAARGVDRNWITMPFRPGTEKSPNRRTQYAVGALIVALFVILIGLFVFNEVREGGNVAIIADVTEEATPEVTATELDPVDATATRVAVRQEIETEIAASATATATPTDTATPSATVTLSRTPSPEPSATATATFTATPTSTPEYQVFFIDALIDDLIAGTALSFDCGAYRRVYDFLTSQLAADNDGEFEPLRSLIGDENSVLNQIYNEDCSNSNEVINLGITRYRELDSELDDFLIEEEPDDEEDNTP